jgi:alkanesulfonate monooxygenase SsuD/methylene tetrahydromethanopterin reductase-like flavin-dependent oxidoreductase (luciferase family)
MKAVQHGATFEQLLQCWREADDAGFDTAWLVDHFMPFGPIAPFLEGWSLLTALLAKTERVRGGLMVAGNTHRHPALLASIGATTDQVSNGRLEFGFGTGYNELEHAAYGWDLPRMAERIRQFEEACEVLKLLWTEDTTTFEGKHYRLRDAASPKPVQKPYPHLVIGAAGEQLTIRAAVRHADEWNWLGGSVETYRRKLDAAERHLAEHGRSSNSLQRSVQFKMAEPYPAATPFAAEVNEFSRLGVDHVILSLAPAPYRPGQVAWLWREIVPAIRHATGR